MEQWLRDHWPEGLVLAVLGLLRWLGVREVNRVDKAIEDHEERLGVLEKDHITREDFDELRSSLTATITNTAERAENRLDLILKHLLERG